MNTFRVVRAHPPLSGRLAVGLFFFLLWCLWWAVPAAGQDGWLTATRLDSGEEISFRWRVIGWDGTQKKNQVEWRFANEAGRSVSFSYRIRMAGGEDRIGRMSLRPGQAKHAGWLFTGSSVADVEVIDVVPASAGDATGR